MRKRLVSTGIALAAAALAIIPADLFGQSTNPLKLVKGTITSEKTGKPINGGRLNVYTGSSSETVTTSKINPKTGFYQVILSPGTNYRFEVISPEYYTTTITMVTPSGTQYEEIVKDLTVAPIPIGTVLLSGRLFDAGSSSLKESADLRRVADILKKERAMAVLITIVPDMAASAKKAAPPKKKGKKGAAVVEIREDKSSVSTQPLGEARMTALKNYFKGHGISTTKLSWNVLPIVQGSGKGKDNVTIKIAAIQTDEENDD